VAVELGTGYVSVVPSAQGFGGALSGILGSELGGVGEQAGQQVGGGLLSGFGGAMAGIAAVGGAAAVGLGVAAFQIGSSFDDAFDTIRVGTGATGEELGGLEDAFRGIVHDVPTDFGSAADAVALLNQRLHLTGQPLQDLSGQFLNLSRITGTDLNTNLETGTRLFGDWGIAAEDQAGTLDELFRAGQASGVAFDQLAGSLVQSGAPLRNLGFSLEESTALLAQFEARGVNADAVLGGMRQSVGRLARAGEDVPTTFRRVVSEIEAMGPGTEATSAAIELFGARAGPDLADAITNGQFAIDDLMSTITGGSDTIAQASADTADFGEKWTLIKNRVLLALEPIATRVFDAVGAAMDHIGPIADEVIAKIQQFLPVIQQYLAPVADFIGQVFTTIAGWFHQGGDETDALGVKVGGLAALFQSAFDAVRVVVETIITIVLDLWHRFGDDIVQFLRDAWDAIAQQINGAITILTGLFDLIKAILTGKWGEAWDAIKEILSGAWQIINGILDAAFAVVRGIFEVALGVLSAAWSAIWNGIKTIASDIWGGIVGVISGGIDLVVGFVTGLPGRIASAVGSAFSAIPNAFRSAVNALIDIWNGFHLSFPGYDIPGPGPNIPSFDIRLPHVSHLAAGGAFSGLAEVGEAGRELVWSPGRSVVVPTHQLMDLTEVTAGTGTGELMHVEHMHIHDRVDVDLVARDLAFAAGVGTFR